MTAAAAGRRRVLCQRMSCSFESSCCQAQGLRRGGVIPGSREDAHVDERLAARFERQLLGADQAADAVAVAERLLAVQAQDLRSARLAVRARAPGSSLAGLDRALTVDRSLVIGWLNRGTLHLVRAEDYWWLHALTTPPLFTGNARRLEQTGVGARAAEKGVALIERALDDGPLTRDELRDRLAA